MVLLLPEQLQDEMPELDLSGARARLWLVRPFREGKPCTVRTWKLLNSICKAHDQVKTWFYLCILQHGKLDVIKRVNYPHPNYSKRNNTKYRFYLSSLLLLIYFWLKLGFSRIFFLLIRSTEHSILETEVKTELKHLKNCTRSCVINWTDSIAS